GSDNDEKAPVSPDLLVDPYTGRRESSRPIIPRLCDGRVQPSPPGSIAEWSREFGARAIEHERWQPSWRSPGGLDCEGVRCAKQGQPSRRIVVRHLCQRSISIVQAPVPDGG